jgi:hypothetical protein
MQRLLDWYVEFFLILEEEEEEGVHWLAWRVGERGGSRDWLGGERLMMGDAGNGCNGTDGGTVAHDEPGVGSERDGCCEG